MHNENKCVFCGVFVRKNYELIKEKFQKHLHANKRQHYYNMQLNNNKKAKRITESMINAVRHIKHHILYTIMITTPDCRMLHYLIVCEQNKQENILQR